MVPGETDKNVPSNCSGPEGRPGQCDGSAVVRNTRSTQQQGSASCQETIGAFPPDPATRCCGVDTHVGSKLAAGVTADVDQYPWLALLEYHKDNKVNLLCGGALISGKYVLTAAHCLDVASRNIGELRFVRLGEYDTNHDGPDCIPAEADGVDCTEGVTRIPVEQTIVHPEYNETLRRDNIGLIRLKTAAPYTDFIRPICLPTSDVTLNPPPNFMLYVAGWGVSTIKTNVKSYTDLQFVDLQECQEVYNATFKAQLWGKQLCAVGQNRTACIGSGGGPLMYENNKIHEFIQVCEHVQDRTHHYIRFDKPQILAKEHRFQPRMIREAIEIKKHPNFNREDGWVLPPAWDPVINIIKSNINQNTARPQDTVSSYCVDRTNNNN